MNEGEDLSKGIKLDHETTKSIPDITNEETTTASLFDENGKLKNNKNGKSQNSSVKIIVLSIILIIGTAFVTITISNDFFPASIAQPTPQTTPMPNTVNQTKPIINMKQEIVTFQNVNQTKIISRVISTVPSNNSTIITLQNGYSFPDSLNTPAKVGNNIEMTIQVSKPVCGLVFYNSNNVLITDPYSLLTSNTFFINGTKNPNCDGTKFAQQVMGLRLVS